MSKIRVPQETDGSVYCRLSTYIWSCSELLLSARYSKNQLEGLTTELRCILNTVQKKILGKYSRLWKISWNIFHVSIFLFRFFLCFREIHLKCRPILWACCWGPAAWQSQVVDLVTFNALISALGVSRQWLRALRTLAAARLHGLQLSSVTYNATVAAIESWRYL